MENNGSKIRKILNNEIAQVIAIIVVVYAFLTMVILPIKSIEQDLNSVKDNHLVHIQESINKLGESQLKAETERRDMMIDINRNYTLIEEALK